jgi:primase-polymerase (primpol)-like protein
VAENKLLKLQIGRLLSAAQQLDVGLQDMLARLTNDEGRTTKQIARDYARARRPRWDQESNRDQLYCEDKAALSDDVDRKSYMWAYTRSKLRCSNRRL